MGKSTAANFFRRMGVAVFSSDAAVHYLYDKNRKVFAAISSRFPSAVIDGKINRRELGRIALADNAARKWLENFIHPLVRNEEMKFLKQNSRQGKRAVLLDIPLLFETGSHNRLDYIYTVSAPSFIQKSRVMKRSLMTGEKYNQIIKLQLKDSIRKKRADKILYSGLGRAYTLRQIKNSLSLLKISAKHKWPDLYRRHCKCVK